ncbi:MAG TPA: SDR family oxidoreductase [Gemmatimonadaceae bacterium]
MPPRPIALITGASAGLGRTFARQLARDGYDVVLVARGEDRLRALADELRMQHGATSEVLVADLSRDDDTARVVQRIDDSPIDLLVNNAGFGTRGSLARASRESQDAMIRVHVLATHRLTQAAVQSMTPRARGAVITVSSTASWLTSPGNVNYGSTKSWQRLQIEALAMELKGKGVYVQALCPGYTRTEFHERGGMDMSGYPSWVWMSADTVVAESLHALRRGRPVVVVPGRGYRLVTLALRVLPAGVLRGLVRLRKRR